MERLLWKRNTQLSILNTLGKMRNLIYKTESSNVFNTVKGKDVVLLVGNTRCGKSTLVNYLIGNPLKANPLRKNNYNIVKQNLNSVGPTIGTGEISETILPSAWPSTKISGLVVDTPGFEENSGEAQDVANSFYIKEIISSAKTVKLVLISDIADLFNDNTGNLINFLDKTLRILPHNGELHKGMVMVFNKDNEDSTKEEIADFFKEKIINQPILHIKNRQLIDYLYLNLNQITIIRRPKTAGSLIESADFDNLVETIEKNALSISNTEMSPIVPGISEKSKGFLLQAHRYLTESKEFDDVLNLALGEFAKGLAKHDSVSTRRSSTDMDALKNELLDLKTRVRSIKANDAPLLTKLAELSTLVPNVKELHKDCETYKKLKFIAFVDDVLRIKESRIIKLRIHGCISTMVDLTDKALFKLQIRMKELTHTELSKKIQEINDNHDNETKLLNAEIVKISEQNQNSMQEQIALLGTVISVIGNVALVALLFF